MNSSYLLLLDLALVVVLVVADPVPGEAARVKLSSDDQSDIRACECDTGRAPDRDRRPLVIEHVAL